MWGDPDHKNADGCYFAPDTKFGPALEQGCLLTTYTYVGGKAGDLPRCVPIGRATLQRDDKGLFVDAQLDADKLSKLSASLLRLIAQGTFAVLALVGIDVITEEGGRIRRFTICEVALSMKPYQPYPAKPKKGKSNA